MADEAGTQIPKDEDVDTVSSKSILLKVAEVVLSVFAIGLIVDPFNSFNRVFYNQTKPKLDDIATIYITIAGFVIINTILILGHLMGDRMPKRTSVLFSAVGTILHIVAGGLIVHNWRRLHGNYAYVYNNTYASKQYVDMLISGGVFTFVNAAVFGVDVFFTIKYF